MSRVVIDTSVWIRYLIRPSAAIRTLVEDLWLGDSIQVVSAPELQTELQDVLARPNIQRFITRAAGKVLLETLLLKATFLPALGDIPAFTRDPKDDKFIACALAGSACYIITTDADLLVLGTVNRVQIVTPEGFLTAFAAAQSTTQG
ncbi:MAG TPA: putative toxin-antitoxin system toxin component, PIN family [Anaerolineae bacterium]|nr:MAG: hypothetical protein BWY25_03014 [Chloroflexi bacterium ADurb.Bin222]HOC22390.1 putative toxin-antitoxin system toxin component, PIN family [Anaerolineae bacterium]HQM14894.1 putative toxin-antitoxin system toxin component, PIN family [Anaerolineae bacterium]